jgi:hypothetical protein
VGFSVSSIRFDPGGLISALSAANGSGLAISSEVSNTRFVSGSSLFTTESVSTGTNGGAGSDASLRCAQSVLMRFIAAAFDLTQSILSPSGTSSPFALSFIRSGVTYLTS